MSTVEVKYLPRSLHSAMERMATIISGAGTEFSVLMIFRMSQVNSVSDPNSEPPLTESPTGQDQDYSKTWWPDVSLVGVALIWGINIPVMKNGLDAVDVYVFNAIRLAISVVALTYFARRERRRSPDVRSTATRRSILIYAVIVSGIYQLMFLLGIARTNSANTALIISTIPMWTALLARIFLKELLSPLAWTGLLTALAGTVVVAVQKGSVSVSSQHLTGNLCVLSAALLWAIGTVYSRPLLKQISPMQLSACSAAIGLPMHILVAWISYQQNPGNLNQLATVNMWLILLYSGVLSTGLALPMWSFGVRHAGAAHAAVIQNLVPLIAIVAALIFRAERLTVPQLIGGLLIIGGLVIMRTTRQTVPSKPAVAVDKA